MDYEAEKEIIFASKKRILLAGYIDLMFFSVLWGLSEYFTGNFPYSRFVFISVFLVIESCLYFFKNSPGLMFLSISDIQTDNGNILIVDDKIYKHETWLTILIGIIAVNSGTKSAIRWVMWTPQMPFFSIHADQEMSAIFSVIYGIIIIYWGYCILKLKAKGFWIGLGINVIGLCYVIMNWSLWDEFIKEAVIMRSQYQGIPLREGKIEFMQMLCPEILCIFLIIHIIIIFSIRKNLTEA